MTTINLREFFYWYKANEFIEVTDEVAAELRADKSYEVNHWRRMKRNKANYSLDAGDGIEHEICEHELSPEESLARIDQYRRLCCALNRLPETQGRRVDAYYLLDMSYQAIASAEGVCEDAVRKAIERGLERMRKIF
ncbi:MAG: sigma-70 family RNA polymerase sigma factor [Eubacteriales bacterium]|nr:sigma-70 family RNA polymerase sigma factor [Eubacteriales bacterium]